MRSAGSRLAGSAKRAKTPTLLHMEATECGAAALGIILGYYGRFERLEDLREACGVTRNGSNARGILLAARERGMEASGFARTPSEVLEGAFPVIVFWGNNHFLVVEGQAGNKVYLNDPALGRRTVSVDEFSAEYSGVVLVLRPGAAFERAGRPQRALPLLVRRLSGAGRAIALVGASSVLLGLFAVVMPAFTRVFVDQILVRKLSSWVDPLLIVMGTGIVLQAAAGWLQQIGLVRLSVWLGLTQSARFVWHVLRLPLQFFAQRQIGDFAQRLEANDRIADLAGGEIGTAAFNLVLAIWTAVALTFYDPALALLAISAGLLSVGFIKVVARAQADNSQRLRGDQARLYSSSIIGLKIMETLKACGATDEFFGSWAGYQARLINTEQALARLNAFASVMPQFLFGLSNALIIGFGGWRVMQGDMSLGSLVAFQMLAAGFGASIQQLANVSGSVQSAKGDLARLEDVSNSPLDWRHSGAAAANGRRIAGGLEIRGLTFGYDRHDAPLICDLDIEVKPGGSIALVGGSGSGKSTIGRLISGLLRPWTGELLIDGIPLESWPRDELAASMAVVEQDVVIFEGTVRDNVALWRDGVPTADILRALRDVDLLDDVLSWPQTIDARIEEGGRNLSGGQRQRLDLARALVRNPRILILDEATSALDTISEKRVLEALRERRCTTIMVAHRLSTIRDCDEIIVLEAGKVVERGTHGALLSLGGAYARMLGQE